MRADFFVHPNYLALEPTRYSTRAKRKPYRKMQTALIDAYSKAAIRALGYNPHHGTGWNTLNRLPEDLVIPTRISQGSVARGGRDRIKELVETKGVTQAVIHGLYINRCLDDFAESLEEATCDIKLITYGIVGARQDDICFFDLRSTRSACAKGDRDLIVEVLADGMKFELEDKEADRFTPDTQVFIV